MKYFKKFENIFFINGFNRGMIIDPQRGNYEFVPNELIDFVNNYENTIDDINEEIIVHRDDFDKFDMIFSYLYKFIVENNPELNNNRNLVRLFLHYMYYNCDIGINE